jgi:acetoacetyl-CoA synthetase
MILDDVLRSKIATAIRSNLSPRFVPDEIIQAPEIPRTLSGKKQEVPLKKLFLGHPPEKVINREVMANPHSIDWYLAEFSRGQCRAFSSP